MKDLPLLELEARIVALERRLAILEHGQTIVEQPKRAESKAPEWRTEAGPIDATTWAVIAAAVAATLTGSHRIRSVRAVVRPPSWGVEGRREHFYSHRVR